MRRPLARILIPRSIALTPAARALRRLLPVLCAFALVTAAQPVPQSSAPGPRGAPPPGLAAALGRAAGAAKVATLGIHVREVASGDTVFARRAGDTFILASNTKLFTTAAALEVLGPGYFFETELVLRGAADGGLLAGDLAAIGGGDPMFSFRLPGGDPFQVFRAWAAALEERGVRRVDGALYLDHGLFGDERLHPDWNPDRYLEWYQVPVDALGFFENVVRVKALPTRSGQPARVVTEPALDYFPIDASVRTVPTWSGNQMRVHRPSGSEALRVTGGVYAGTDELEKPIAVDDPVALFGAALRHALGRSGVAIAGPNVPVADLPGLVWEPVAVHRSALLDVVEVTNHESNNLMADTLLKLVGAVRCGAGTWENGSRAVEEIVARIGGLDTDDFSFVDGSGLARGNRMAPADVTRFLAGAWRQPWAGAWVETLPTGGDDPSSLKERLEQHRGRFYAKTGTIAGVSALSGYAFGRSGRVYAFSVLAHGGAGPARAVQDAVVEAIVVNG
jgi:serine-type D-Ala-D-Ala carboxypeptidase/endopeptidase (penicillin-binding protein 4)